MKKIVLAIFSFILCLALVGCELGGNQNGEKVSLGKVTINFMSDENLEKSEKYSDDLEMYVPTKLGYDFLGWEINGKLVDFDSLKITIDALKEVTLKNIELDLNARWEKHKFVISYDVNGGEAIEDGLVEYKSSVSALPTPVRENYIFLGWYSDIELTTEYELDTSVEEDFTLYAKWVKSKMSVTYEVNGGEAIETSIVDYNNPISEVPTPEKEGSHFIGWYSDIELTKEFDKKQQITEDLVLYAKWEIDKVTVAFFDTDYEVLVVDWGTELRNLPTPERENRYFKGWFLDPNHKTSYVEGTPIKENTILYPLFGKKTYTVYFETNGGNDMDPIEKNADTPLGDITATRVGYRFKGWYIDQELTIRFDYSDIVSKNMMLYASWEANTYTVTLNYNPPKTIDEFGELKELTIQNKMVPNTISVIYDELVSITNPICEGYTFGGWYRDEDLTVKWNSYTKVRTNVTLYAKWILVTHAITFVYDNGLPNYIDSNSIKLDKDNIIKNGLEVVDGQTALAPKPDPTIEGYRFFGWYKDRDCTIPWDWGKDVVTKDVVLYSLWKESLSS